MKTLIILSFAAIAVSASAAVSASDCVSPVSLEYQVTSQGNTKDIAIHRAGRELVRLPAQQIVVSYENPVLAWSLTEQGDSGLQQRLASRDDYTLIDFADIGDSEENPFVKKMINWGFVEHGASGFYDEHGHAIEGHGHAH